MTCICLIQAYFCTASLLRVMSVVSDSQADASRIKRAADSQFEETPEGDQLTCVSDDPLCADETCCS